MQVRTGLTDADVGLFACGFLPEGTLLACSRNA